MGYISLRLKHVGAKGREEIYYDSSSIRVASLLAPVLEERCGIALSGEVFTRQRYSV